MSSITTWLAVYICHIGSKTLPKKWHFITTCNYVTAKSIAPRASDRNMIHHHIIHKTLVRRVNTRLVGGMGVPEAKNVPFQGAEGMRLWCHTYLTFGKQKYSNRLYKHYKSLMSWNNMIWEAIDREQGCYREPKNALYFTGGKNATNEVFWNMSSYKFRNTCIIDR